MKTSWQDYKPIFIGLGALIFLLTAIFYWASATQISGAIIGAGIVQVDESQHAVSHQQGGIVSNIFAHNGDYVKQGDVLVTLDSTTLQAELGIIEGELFETLAKEARLYSELGNETTVKVDGLLQQLLSQIPEIQERIDRQQIHLTSNVLSTNSAQQLFGKKIDQIAKQVLGTQAQLKAKQQQIQLLERDIKREEDSFKKGLIKYSLLSANKEKRAQFQGERGALVAKEAELQEKIIEHKIDIAAAHEKFRNTAIEELNKIQALKIKLLEQRKATQEELKLLTIRAPVKGRIHDSKLLGINSVVKPGTPILHIVPDNKPAFVAIRIDARDIENVYPEQSALLKFRSFNLRATPLIEGKVINISPDVYMDKIKKKPYYEVHLEVTQQGLDQLADKHLVQGMPVEGFITTQDHTPLEYIASPVIAYFDKALR